MKYPCGSAQEKAQHIDRQALVLAVLSCTPYPKQVETQSVECKGFVPCSLSCCEHGRYDAQTQSELAGYPIRYPV